MKKTILFLSAAFCIAGCSQPAEKKEDTSNYQKEVTDAVEGLRKQLLEPQKADLEKMVVNNLTYGHSSGLVEDHQQFIESLVSGKFDFTTLDLTEQTIDINGQTAIVRHHLVGNTADVGKEPGTADLKVMQVWQKQGADWKLLARQAVKQLPPK